ncbi:sn-glycerol-3-phosphate ABC transporter substrate-binding protein UgpB [Limoniibacter endophyticus]|uniref:sn-glycerol-3-phosphate-binding periplasmic protein UgpB n=1 Tax=Limoniibacter endophyticus TaxID=1565040 RepID=A0A8J3DGK7_9HYPH|nr:sn-glycerol-3-phosphate ABC transporter substrate-binding protein UgpB [Limoniibacter endophyticus]GHC65179.1 ABC transporter substrate-binding protein [Limoniibacter endophyticus]
MRSTLKTLLLAAVSVAAVSPAFAQTEIQFWHGFNGRLAELLNAQVEEFNGSQSDYKVVATPKGTYAETLNAGIAAFRAGEQPHILQVFEVGTATMMAAKGAVKPVYELMAESGLPFDPKNYLSPVAGYYTNTDNQMLSLPYNSSTPVMYVNRDALEEAGIDPDIDLSTWEKVTPVLAKLKQSGRSCGFTTSWMSWIQLETMSALHNIEFATNENGFGGFDTELKFNQPLHVQHISLLGDWAKEGYFQYGGRSSAAGPLFRSGECAIYTESSAGYAGIKSEAKFDFDVRRLPYHEGVEGAPQNTIIGGASLWAMSGKTADEYKGVAAFMNFLSSTDIQAKWHQDTGYLPITNAAYEKTKADGFYEKNPGTDIAILQMTEKEPTAISKGVRLGFFSQIRDIVDEELEGVWNGSKTAEDALNTAVERGNEQLRRFESANSAGN